MKASTRDPTCRPPRAGRIDRPSARTRRNGNCHACVFKSGCLPAELEDQHLTRFEQTVGRPQHPLRAGQILVRQGDPIDTLYALRAGAMKAFFDAADGTERVMAFRFPGTIIGLAEAYQTRWSRSLSALEDSWLCHIPLHAIDNVLQRQLMHLMSECLRREYEAHLTLALNGGARRVIAFLLDLSAIFSARGQSAVDLRLPMTYLDIASHLGMRHESLSRTLSQLEQQGLIQKSGRIIHLSDIDRLRRIKHEMETP
ncbi:Crp/Fnr family transcriptional regulator [Salinisphaera sp. RV14]